MDPHPLPPSDSERPTDASDATLEEASDASAPSLFARLAKGVGVFLLVVFGLVAALVVALQTRPVAERALGYILDAANPYENASLTVGEVRGNWISGLRLYDLRLKREDGTAMAVIDTLEAKYNLMAIPGGRLHLRDVYLAGAYFNVQEGPDGEFDISVPFLPDTLAAVDTTGGLKVQVDDLVVRRTYADVVFYNPRADSVLRVRGLVADLDDLLLTEEVAFDLHVLRFAYALPSDLGTGYFRTGASMHDRVLTVDSLRLISDHSRVRADGRLRLPESDDADVSDIQFQVAAQPLSFRDLSPFLPLDVTRSVSLTGEVRGSPRLLAVDLAGALSDGATLSLVGQFTPAADGDVLYDLEGQVQNLDPAFFAAPGTPSSGTINLAFQTDLSGERLEALTGTAEATLTDSRVGDFALATTRLDVRFSDGRGRIDLTSGLRGADLRVGGEVWPFAEVPRYNLTGGFRNVDLARFSEGGTQTSDLDGVLTIRGTGFDPETADLTAQLRLLPSRINAYEIRTGLVTATLDHGDLGFTARVGLPEGLIAARGSASLGEPLTYRVIDGRVENLDVAALTGDTTFSRVNATFSLRGAGTDPAAMRLTADVDLGRTIYGAYTVEDARMTARLRSGQLTTDLRATLDGGYVEAVATARPFHAVPTYTIREATFRDVDLGRLTQNPDLSTDLAGTLELTGTGFDPETMALEARLTLDGSRVNDQRIERAFLTGDLVRGSLDFTLGLDVPGGETRLEGAARPFDEVPTYAVSRGVYGGVDVGALTGNPALTTNLNGTVTLEGRGLDPQAMTLAINLGMGRSRVNNGHIESGTLDLSLIEGLAVLDADVDLLSGRATLAAGGRLFDEVPVYTAEGFVRHLNAAAFAGVDTLDALASMAFSVEGRGFDPETMTLAAHLYADSTRFNDVTLDTLAARVYLADGLLRVDTLGIASNVLSATANGQIVLFDTLGVRPDSSDLRLDATLHDLLPLRPFLDAEVIAADRGQIDARAYGRSGNLTFEVAAELRSLIYNDLRLAGLNMTASGQVDASRSLQVAEVNGELTYFSLPGMNLRNTRLDARYAEEELAFGVAVDADDRRDARLVGKLDLRPDANTVIIDSLGFRFDQDRWKLLQPSTISYGDRYVIDGFLLTTGTQQIAIDGAIDPRGDQSLIFTIDGFRVGAVADIFGYEGLDGTLSGSVDLTGPAFAPNLLGTLNLDVVSYRETVGDVVIDLRYDSLRLNTEALFTHNDGSTLAIDGYVPLDLRIAPANPEGETAAAEGVTLQRAEAPVSGDVNFTIVADSFAIGWIRPFVDPTVISTISGKLDADMVFGGTFESPTLEGDAALVDGRLGLTELGETYTDIEARLVLGANEARVERFKAQGGGGTLSATGTIALTNLALGEFDLDYRLTEFRGISNEQFRFVLEGRGSLTGTTTAPVVDGNIRVLSGDINLVDAVAFEDVQLTQEDILTVESRFGLRVTEADTTINQVYEAMTLDVSVTLERDMWLRKVANPQMDIQFDGQIDVRKRPGTEIALYGDIEVIPERSRVIQFGRRFDLTGGEIQFNGPLTEMLLDIEAAYQVRTQRSRETGPTITLGISGRLDDLDLTLGSEPQMETADIVSYIATGRPADQSLQFSSGSDTEGGGFLQQGLGQGAGLALGQLASAIEGVAARDLGLDVIEIEQDGLRGTRLTAGRYFSRRLYASISQPITYGNQSTDSRNAGERPTVVTLEYEVSNALLARLVRDGATVRMNLLWEFAY